MSESQSPSHVKILLGFVVFCVIVQMLGLYDFTTLMSDKPKDKPKDKPSNVIASPPLNTPNVKYIEIIKDNSPSSVYKYAGDSPSFAIKELKAYDENNILIGKSEYSSAVFTPENSLSLGMPGMNALDGDENTIAHSADDISPKLLFTLSSLKFIKKVLVTNHASNARQNGVKLNLYNANMSLIKSCTLTANPSTECSW